VPRIAAVNRFGDVVRKAIQRRKWRAKRGAPLSKREAQVLRMTAEGKASGEIARLLKVSQVTVQTYRERLKFKLGVPTLHQLIRVATLSHPGGTRTIRDINRPLSPRERQILQLLGEGKSTVELARQLRRSPKTTQALCTRIKSKIGISSFGELMRIAVLWREGKLVLRKQ
jgi:DNA-binding CsgD family transcriptional regulator